MNPIQFSIPTPMTAVYKRFIDPLRLIYACGVLLKVQRFPASAAPIDRARRTREGGKDSPMSINYRDLILIFAAGLIEAFLLWTLWNFLKAGRRKPARGGAWKINEGQKTRRAARPFQDLPAAAYLKPAANDEKVRPIRVPLSQAR